MDDIWDKLDAYTKSDYLNSSEDENYDHDISFKITRRRHIRNQELGDTEVGEASLRGEDVVVWQQVTQETKLLSSKIRENLHDSLLDEMRKSDLHGNTRDVQEKIDRMSHEKLHEKEELNEMQQTAQVISKDARMSATEVLSTITNSETMDQEESGQTGEYLKRIRSTETDDVDLPDIDPLATPLNFGAMKSKAGIARQGSMKDRRKPKRKSWVPEMEGLDEDQQESEPVGDVWVTRPRTEDDGDEPLTSSSSEDEPEVRTPKPHQRSGVALPGLGDALKIQLTRSELKRPTALGLVKSAKDVKDNEIIKEVRTETLPDKPDWMKEIEERKKNPKTPPARQQKPLPSTTSELDDVFEQRQQKSKSFAGYLGGHLALSHGNSDAELHVKSHQEHIVGHQGRDVDPILQMKLLERRRHVRPSDNDYIYANMDSYTYVEPYEEPYKEGFMDPRAEQVTSPQAGPFARPVAGNFPRPHGGPLGSPLAGPFPRPHGGSLTPPFPRPPGGLLVSPHTRPFPRPNRGPLAGPHPGPFVRPHEAPLVGPPMGRFPGPYPGPIVGPRTEPSANLESMRGGAVKEKSRLKTENVSPELQQVFEKRKQSKPLDSLGSGEDDVAFKPRNVHLEKNEESELDSVFQKRKQRQSLEAASSEDADDYQFPKPVRARLQDPKVGPLHSGTEVKMATITNMAPLTYDYEAEYADPDQQGNTDGPIAANYTESAENTNVGALVAQFVFDPTHAARATMGCIPGNQKPALPPKPFLPGSRSDDATSGRGFMTAGLGYVVGHGEYVTSPRGRDEKVKKIVVESPTSSNSEPRSFLEQLSQKPGASSQGKSLGQARGDTLENMEWERRELRSEKESPTPNRLCHNSMNGNSFPSDMKQFQLKEPPSHLPPINTQYPTYSSTQRSNSRPHSYPSYLPNKFSFDTKAFDLQFLSTPSAEHSPLSPRESWATSKLGRGNRPYSVTVREVSRPKGEVDFVDENRVKVHASYTSVSKPSRLLTTNNSVLHVNTCDIRRSSDNSRIDNERLSNGSHHEIPNDRQLASSVSYVSGVHGSHERISRPRFRSNHVNRVMSPDRCGHQRTKKDKNSMKLDHHGITRVSSPNGYCSSDKSNWVDGRPSFRSRSEDRSIHEEATSKVEFRNERQNNRTRSPDRSNCQDSQPSYRSRSSDRSRQNNRLEHSEKMSSVVNNKFEQQDVQRIVNPSGTKRVHIVSRSEDQVLRKVQNGDRSENQDMSRNQKIKRIQNLDQSSNDQIGKYQRHEESNYQGITRIQNVGSSSGQQFRKHERLNDKENGEVHVVRPRVINLNEFPCGVYHNLDSDAALCEKDPTDARNRRITFMNSGNSFPNGRSDYEDFENRRKAPFSEQGNILGQEERLKPVSVTVKSLPESPLYGSPVVECVWSHEVNGSGKSVLNGDVRMGGNTKTTNGYLDDTEDSAPANWKQEWQEKKRSKGKRSKSPKPKESKSEQSGGKSDMVKWHQRLLGIRKLWGSEEGVETSNQSNPEDLVKKDSKIDL